MIVTEIIQPSVDNSTVIVAVSASPVQLMCSLNIDIPSSVEVTWLYNGSTIVTTPPNEVTQTGNTTTLLIRDLQPSNAGVYQCVFNDTVSNWILRRNISLLITGTYVFMLNYSQVLNSIECQFGIATVRHSILIIHPGF